MFSKCERAVLKAFVAEAFETEYKAIALLPDAAERRRSMMALILKAGKFDESKHPRDDGGRFVSKDAIQQAKSDPKKAKELKKRVTNPEQRKKLDAALADPEVIGTKRGLKRHENETKRAEKVANRAKAREIRIRLIDQDSRGEELNPDDLRALIPHLSEMSHPELSHTRELLARQGASFGGKRLRADRVAALVAWATGKAAPQPAEADGRDDIERDADEALAAIRAKRERNAAKREKEFKELGQQLGEGYAEFERSKKEDAEALTLTRSQYVEKYGNPSERKQFGIRHERLVRDAVARGETVPNSVLVDYPDLYRGREDSLAASKPLGEYLAAGGRSPENVDKVLASPLASRGNRLNAATGATLEGFAANDAKRHRESVIRQLAAGKPVPAEVLADYPDLAAKYAKPDTGTAAAQPAPAGTSAAPPKTRLQALAEKAHAQGTPNDDVNTEYATPRDQYLAFTRGVVPPTGTKPDSATVLDYLSKLPDHARERLDQHFRAGGKSLREIEQFHRQAAGQVSPEQVRADRAARADAGDAARAAMSGTNAAPAPDYEKHVAQMDKAEAAAEDQIRRVGETEAGAKRVRAERMVPAWIHHTGKGNAASAAEAERRILSHGAERLHAAGETVPFDGRTMEAQTGVSDGAPVRVTRHGWHMPGDALPLTQAQVEPVASGSGAATNLDTGARAANNAPATQGGGMNVDAAHSLWQAIGGARADSLEATAEKFKQIESLPPDVARGLVERLGFSPERSHKGNVEKLRRSLTNLRLNQQRADSITGSGAAPTAGGGGSEPPKVPPVASGAGEEPDEDFRAVLPVGKTHPWQMTRGEFAASQNRIMAYAEKKHPNDRQAASDVRAKLFGRLAGEHQDHIARAIVQGQPVPVSAIDEYVRPKLEDMLLRGESVPEQYVTDEMRGRVAKTKATNIASKQISAAGLRTEWDDARRVLYIRTSNPATGNVVVTPIDDVSESGVAAAIKRHKREVKGRDTTTRTRMRVEKED